MMDKMAREQQIRPESGSFFYRTDICYDITAYENSIKLREKIKLNHLSEITRNPVSPDKEKQMEQQLKQKINKINRKIIEHSMLYKFDDLNQQTNDRPPSIHKIPKIGDDSLEFLGKAIVTLTYQPFRNYFLNEFNQDKPFFIQQNPIKISKANKPQDIYWQNLKVTDQQRYENLFHSYAILFLQLVVSFTILLVLQLWHLKMKPQTTSTTKEQGQFKAKMRSVFISLSMSIATNGINSLLQYSIKKLSNMERHKAASNKTSSLIIKTVVAQTINTMVIYSIIQLIRPFNLIGNMGLGSRIQSLVFFSGIITLGLNLIPYQRIKAAVSRFAQKIFSKNKIGYFQVQLNQEQQLPAFNFTQKFAFYIVFTYTVSFYGLVVPRGSPYLVCVFICLYWLDKYNLFRRSSNVTNIDFFTIKASLVFLQFSQLVCIVGYLRWDYLIHFDSDLGYRCLNIFSFILVVVYLAYTFGFHYARDKNWVDQFCVNKREIFQYKNIFKNTYQSKNPTLAFTHKSVPPQQLFQNQAWNLFSEWSSNANSQKIKKTDYDDDNENMLELWESWIEKNNQATESQIKKYEKIDVQLFEQISSNVQEKLETLIKSMK